MWDFYPNRWHEFGSCLFTSSSATEASGSPSFAGPDWGRAFRIRDARHKWVKLNNSLSLSILSRSLRKHAYTNILKISPPQNWKFSVKNSDSFHISAQNIDCGHSLEPPRWGGSNKYPQSMFLSRNMKTNVHPCKPQFYYIKVGFKGVNII